MNLYNVVFGLCPAGMGLLALLDLEPWKGMERFGRFRDCYLRRIDGELRVHLLTRNGGKHRPEFYGVTRWLRSQPAFARDFDEPFDPTFLTYEFRINDRIRSQVEHLIEAAPELAIYEDFGERWSAALRRLQEEPDHPDSVRIIRTVRPKLDAALLTATKSGSATLLDDDHELRRGKD